MPSSPFIKFTSKKCRPPIIKFDQMCPPPPIIRVPRVGNKADYIFNRMSLNTNLRGGLEDKEIQNKLEKVFKITYLS